MTTNSVNALVAQSTTLQLNLPESLATELAGLHALDHLDTEDKPIPAFAYNTKIQMPDGSWLPKDIFFNTLSGEVKNEIHCVLLHIKKSRRWATYSETSGMTEHCSSDNGTDGIRTDGKVADCASCKHRIWGRVNGQASAPDCDIVYIMLAVDLADDNPFIIRARATSRKPVQRYLARNFLGKLHLPDGSRADLPLFVCNTKLSLTMPTGTYAVLRLSKNSDCTEAEIRTYKQIYEGLKGVLQPNCHDNGAEDQDQ